MDFFTVVGLNACFYFIIYVIFLWVFDCDLQLAFYEKFGRKLVNLRGKVMWITGAPSELGKMMALKAAKYHAKLVLSGKSKTELEKIKRLCLTMNPYLRARDILILQFDVKDLTGHQRALEKVINHFGSMDMLILNEGNKWERGLWERGRLNSDRLLFQSNVFGVVSLSRLAVRYFNGKGKGKLVVRSSIGALVGVPYFGRCAAADHALHGYFKSLRIEKFGENIQSTLLCVGSSELSREKYSKGEQLVDSEEKTSGWGEKKKMTIERCAHLCLTAIVNDLDEVWIAVFPILALIYGIKFYPNVTKSVLRYLKSREP